MNTWWRDASETKLYITITNENNDGQDDDDDDDDGDDDDATAIALLVMLIVVIHFLLSGQMRCSSKTWRCWWKFNNFIS